MLLRFPTSACNRDTSRQRKNRMLKTQALSSTFCSHGSSPPSECISVKKCRWKNTVYCSLGFHRQNPRLLLNCDVVWKNEGKEGKTLCPRLGLEVPDVRLPDIGDRTLDMPVFGALSKVIPQANPMSGQHRGLKNTTMRWRASKCGRLRLL